MGDAGPTRTSADLADVVELLLDKGLVVNADIAVSIGDTQLLGIQVRAAVASFETAAKYGLEFPEGTDQRRIDEVASQSRLGGEDAAAERGAPEMQRAEGIEISEPTPDDPTVEAPEEGEEAAPVASSGQSESAGGSPRRIESASASDSGSPGSGASEDDPTRVDREAPPPEEREGDSADERQGESGDGAPTDAGDYPPPLRTFDPPEGEDSSEASAEEETTDESTTEDDDDGD